MSDAERTIRFAIENGLATSWGEGPESVCDTIYKSVTCESITWAWKELANEHN